MANSDELVRSGARLGVAAVLNEYRVYTARGEDLGLWPGRTPDDAAEEAERNWRVVAELEEEFALGERDMPLRAEWVRALRGYVDPVGGLDDADGMSP